MGLFDDIGKAQYFEGGKYIGPGAYKAKILKVKQDKTRNGRPFFVTELEVLETSDPKEFPVGTSFSWMVMLDQDAALGNIRHFLAVASDAPINEIGKADAEEAISEANPLAGVIVRISATNIKTKQGKDFTKVKFISANVSAEEAAKQHAEDKAAAAAPAA